MNAEAQAKPELCISPMKHKPSSVSESPESETQREGDCSAAPCSLCEGMGELDGFGGGGRTDCHKCRGTGKENAGGDA